MTSNFQIVFSVTVSHSYYTNGNCTCLEFVPGNATTALLKQYGFKLNYGKSGFNLFVNTKSRVSGLLAHIQDVSGQDSFCFDIVSKDASFFLFTDMPANQAGGMLYDSGSTANTVGQEGVGLTVSYTASNTMTSAGQLIIRLKDLMSVPPTFRISYEARSTQWQYYIISRSPMVLNQPAITGKNEVGFEGPQNVTIPTGQQALLFSSGNTLLPLSEQPYYKFDLVAKSDNGGRAAKVVFKGLPNPDPDRMGTVMINNKSEISSPIYVYI